MTIGGDEGDVFLLFRKKEGTEEKPILSFSRLTFIRYIWFRFSLYERRRAITALRYLLTQSQRQFCFVAGFCLSRDSLS